MHVTKCYWGDIIKEDQMVRACGMYRGEEKCILGFSGETWKKDTWVDHHMDERVVSEQMIKK